MQFIRKDKLPHSHSFVVPSPSNAFSAPLQIFLSLKYYNVLKWENRFTLGQTAAKITVLPDVWLYPYIYRFFEYVRICIQIFPKIRIFKIFWEFNLISAKVPIISKNASNKSCPKLNFLWKTHLMHISISPRSGAWGGGVQTFVVFKWYNRMEKQVHFRAECFQKY